MNDIIKPDNNHSLINGYLTSLPPETFRAYKNDWKKFIDIVKKDINQIDEQDIVKYIKALKDHTNPVYKNNTINRKVYSVKKILKTMVQDGIIDYSPMDRLAAATKISEPITRNGNLDLTLQDIEKVTKEAPQETALIIRFLVNTGLRINEALSITKSNITLNDKYAKIYIRGKGNRERDIYISKELYNQIVKLFTKDSEYMFHSRTGKRLNRNNLYKQIHRAFDHIGKDIHPHSLRHFFVRYQIHDMKRDIKAVSRYVGHSSVAYTLEVYHQAELSPDETMIF